MLSNPAPGEWLSWRRGHQGRGFSPLKEITKENVSRLQMAWSLTLPAGPNTIEPLFHDGVLFVYAYGDRVFALDGETGDELWRYERRLPENQRLTSKRTMALWGNKLYTATSDAHLVALDTKTGRVVWDRDVGQGTGRISGGPLVANGVVMQGLVGAQIPGGSSIAAVDAETGEPLWRFSTVAQPGTPAGNSWNDLPAEEAWWWFGVDLRHLRCRARSRLLRPRSDLRHRADALPRRQARRHQRWAVHGYHARVPAAHRRAGLVFPAHAQRPVGHGLGLRARHHSAAGQWPNAQGRGHFRQGGLVRRARCGHWRIPDVVRHGSAELHHRCGSENRREEDRSRHAAGWSRSHHHHLSLGWRWPQLDAHLA